MWSEPKIGPRFHLLSPDDTRHSERAVDEAPFKSDEANRESLSPTSLSRMSLYVALRFLPVVASLLPSAVISGFQFHSTDRLYSHVTSRTLWRTFLS